MGMKHTPGPWVCERDEHFGPGFVITAPGMQNRCPVVRMQSPLGEADETLEADARLIAAAPELLEALKAAVECGMVPNSSAADGGPNKHIEQVRVADQIRAAIAKAEPSPLRTTTSKAG